MTKCVITNDGSLYEFTELNLDKAQKDYKKQINKIEDDYFDKYLVDFNEVEVNSLNEGDILKEYVLTRQDIKRSAIKRAVDSLGSFSKYFLILYAIMFLGDRTLLHFNVDSTSDIFFFFDLISSLYWVLFAFVLYETIEFIFYIKEYIKPYKRLKVVKFNNYSNGNLIKSSWLFYTPQSFYVKFKSLIICAMILLPLFLIYD